MAANGNPAVPQAFAPENVLHAYETTRSNVDGTQKGEALEFLQSFQKAPDSWTQTFGFLQSQTIPPDAKLFAATTLKGKIVYDIHQLPREALPQLRDQLLSTVAAYRAGPKVIRTQLCVCLARLAIQMTEWSNVLDGVLQSLGSSDQDSITSILTFLQVLPEEVTEGRKVNLTEDELEKRTVELLEDNAPKVATLLNQFAESSPDAVKNEQFIKCVSSWSKELPMNDIVNSSLLAAVFHALDTDESFEAAVDCITTVINETKDVDECLSTIQKLYPRVVALRPRLAQAAEAEETEIFRGITKILCESGETWSLLIAREPQQFRGLVEAILEAAARDQEREAIGYTFQFWYELKQYLTLEKYIQARIQYVDIYSKLVDVMVGHLEFPKPEDGTGADLFDGDRTAEEKFREFRHNMGDVLKDCCEVIGVTECLSKSYALIEEWFQKYGTQAANGQAPEWQKLEAALFSMRAMGRTVPVEESIMLPRLISKIVTLPPHEKLQFQAIMALSRYTEWTAQHEEALQPQLDFIIAAFGSSSVEVVRAAALAFKFFCNDCADLLKSHCHALQQFYVGKLDSLPVTSQQEITEGVASVVARQPVGSLYNWLKLYCDPIMSKLVEMAQNASTKQVKWALGDKMQLITVFMQWVQPYVPLGQPNPAVQYCQEIFPVQAAIVERFIDNTLIVERVCRCWRYMVFSNRTSIAPLLPQLAEKLSWGFSASRQGCFLWATDAIVREFSEGVEDVDQETINAIFKFYEQQAQTFLTALNDLSQKPEEFNDVIEDFFRLSMDVLVYYKVPALTSPLMAHIVAAVSPALTLLKADSLFPVLHWLRDFLNGGMPNAISSGFGTPPTNPPEVQAATKRLLAQYGQELATRMLVGMMFNFPADCVPDASGVLLDMFHVAPQDTANWVSHTINELPAGSLTDAEKHRFLANIEQRIQASMQSGDISDLRAIRSVLQDFTTSYRRRNVAPREGLGRLEAAKFKFEG